MDDNPLSPYSTGGGGGGQGPTEFSSTGFEVGELLAEAWEIVKAQWLNLLIGFAVFFGVTFIVNFVTNFFPSLLQGVLTGASRGDSDSAELLVAAFGLMSCCGAVVNFAVQSFMTVGFLRYNLGIVRQEEVTVGQIFSGGDRVLSFIVAQLVVGLATVIGFVFFIVPGVLLALGLSLVQYMVADTGLGFVECIRASWALTDGHKMNIFILGLALAGLMIVGIIPCFLGIPVVAALGAVATPLVYVRLTGRTSSGLGDPTVA